jgi:hypothetical protein
MSDSDIQVKNQPADSGAPEKGMNERDLNILFYQYGATGCWYRGTHRFLDSVRAML